MATDAAVKIVWFDGNTDHAERLIAELVGDGWKIIASSAGAVVSSGKTANPYQESCAYGMPTMAATSGNVHPHGFVILQR